MKILTLFFLALCVADAQVWFNTFTGRVERGVYVGTQRFPGPVEIGTPLPTTIGNNGLLRTPVVCSASPCTATVATIYYCDVAGGCQFNLPAISAANIGGTWIFRQKYGRSGALRIQAQGSGVIVGGDGEHGATTPGYATTAGGKGDSGAVQSLDDGWYLWPGAVTWTNN
jgi:hypothetical protein